MRLSHLLPIALLAAAGSPAAAQPSPTPAAPAAGTSADRDAVVRAALAYVDGFYEGDTAKLARALRPDLSKYGFWRDPARGYAGTRMTYDQALALGRELGARGGAVDPAWPREVVVYEVLDRTASAKVTARWGTDYLLLGKVDGAWKIFHVLWQSAPPRDAGAR